MADTTRGLYGKFTVTRTDGTSEPGKKHDGCAYFVLDMSHDKHAAPALRAYADSCEMESPALARDLRLEAYATSRIGVRTGNRGLADDV